MNLKAIAAAAALHLFIAAPTAAQAQQGSGAISVTSPDGTARIAISADGTSVAVWRKGEQIVAPSAVGLDLLGAGPGPLKLVGSSASSAIASSR